MHLSVCAPHPVSRYLYGNGHNLFLYVLVEQTDGSSQVLPCALICVIRFDAVQHLIVHYVDVTCLGGGGLELYNVGQKHCHH